MHIGERSTLSMVGIGEVGTPGIANATLARVRFHNWPGEAPATNQSYRRAKLSTIARNGLLA